MKFDRFIYPVNPEDKEKFLTTTETLVGLVTTRSSTGPQTFAYLKTPSLGYTDSNQVDIQPIREILQQAAPGIRVPDDLAVHELANNRYLVSNLQGGDALNNVLQAGLELTKSKDPVYLPTNIRPHSNPPALPILDNIDDLDDEGSKEGPNPNQTHIQVPNTKIEQLQKHNKPQLAKTSTKSAASEKTPKPKPDYQASFPEEVWEGLAKVEGAQADVAVKYFDSIIWSTAPDVYLLTELKNSSDNLTRSRLIQEIVRKRNLVPENQAELQSLKILLERTKVELVQAGVAAANETIEHAKKWRDLARYAPWFLSVTIVFAMVAASFLIAKLDAGKIDGYELALILFVLALFAASPSVLLLLERPLKGIDEWSPRGITKPEREQPASELQEPTNE